MELITYKIRDLVSKIIDNRGKNPDNYYDEGPHPVIDNYLIKNELHPNLDNVDRFLTDEQFSTFLRGYIDEGDLLITLVGNGYGSCTLSPDNNCAIVQNTIGLKINNLSSSDFLFYYFSQIKESIKNLDRGSAQPSINREDLLNLKIKIPEKDVQDKIVRTIKSYDLLIENNKKKIKILEEFVDDIYKEWIIKCRINKSNFIETKPKGWIYGKNKLMNIPTDWHFGPLEEIGRFIRGKNITSSEMIEGKIPVVSAGKDYSGFHNKANVYGKSLTMSASGANAGYLKYNLDDIWAADCSYYQNDDNIWFVYSSLKFLKLAINNLQIGSAQPHVYPKDINKLDILIPDEKIIKLYNNYVNPFFEEIKCLDQKNDLLIEKKNNILLRMMSGQIDVSEVV